MSQSNFAFSTLQRWLIFSGLLAAGIWVAYAKGLIGLMIASDRSSLSAVILAFFLLFSAIAGWRAWRLGRELQATFDLSQRARGPATILELTGQSVIRVAGASETTSIAHQHLAFLAEKYRHQGSITGQDLLLDRLEVSLRRGHQTGWFVADLMIRLGLLGTVIGFIFMLSSIATVENVDLHTMQQLLSNMSGGMRIALYTTLAGLSAGILLGFQYQLLDQAADHLLAEIIELSEVHAASHLRLFIEQTG